MITLNRVVKNLNNIATAHSQINHFFFGEMADFASSGSINYPAMAATLQPFSFEQNLLVMSFDIYVLDLVHKDLSNSTEVLSDTLQTCLDIIAIANDPNVYSWNPVKNNILNDIQGGLDDEITGYWFNLKLRVPNPLDACQVPLKNAIIALNEINNSDERLIDDTGEYFLLSDTGLNLIKD